MRGVVRCLLQGGLLPILVLSCMYGAALGQECQLTIREDMYFMPATEMAGEQSFPEVVILENDEVSVWAVPNRGRLVFDLVRKETGNSQLVARPNPTPLRIRGLYTFEFGGVYATFPWHRRDNQPMLLEWEPLEDGDGCAVRMWSKDPGTDVTLLVEVRLPAIGSATFLSLRLANPGPNDLVVDFGLVIAARPGGAASEDMELVLPVPSVTLGESEARWMGEEGREVAWPAPWNRWGSFEGPGWFFAKMKDFQKPFLFVYNPQTDEHLRITWRPEEPWSTCVLFSWGPGYVDEMGAYDGFRVELCADGLRVPGGGERILHLEIAAKGGRPFYGLPER